MAKLIEGFYKIAQPIYMHPLPFLNNLFGTKYSRVDQVKFVEDGVLKILLGPLLNTLSHMFMKLIW